MGIRFLNEHEKQQTATCLQYTKAYFKFSLIYDSYIQIYLINIIDKIYLNFKSFHTLIVNAFGKPVICILTYSLLFDNLYYIINSCLCHKNFKLYTKYHPAP